MSEARKVRAISLLAEPGFETGFYFRPFGVDDAEIHAVPNAAGCGHHVIAKDAFLAPMRKIAARDLSFSESVFSSTRMHLRVSKA